jgi:hypothetical protein
MKQDTFARNLRLATVNASTVNNLLSLTESLRNVSTFDGLLFPQKMPMINTLVEFNNFPNIGHNWTDELLYSGNPPVVNN